MGLSQLSRGTMKPDRLIVIHTHIQTDRHDTLMSKMSPPLGTKKTLLCLFWIPKICSPEAIDKQGKTQEPDGEIILSRPSPTLCFHLSALLFSPPLFLFPPLHISMGDAGGLINPILTLSLILPQCPWKSISPLLPRSLCFPSVPPPLCSPSPLLPLSSASPFPLLPCLLNLY